MNIIRRKKISQANVIGNECSDDTQDTAWFSNPTQSSQNWTFRENL